MRANYLLLLLSMLAVAVGLAVPAASNANGAPDPAFDSGCNCHGPPATNIQTVLTVPAEYEAGTTYDLTLRVMGGPTPVPVVSQNQGGFAAKVDLGKFVAGTGTQLRHEGLGITHTTAGNDVRSWTFQWVAPSPAAGSATFTYWGNAVNGDTTAQQDSWARGPAAVVPPKGAMNATANETSAPETETPFVSAIVAGSVVFVVAVWLRRPT